MTKLKENKINCPDTRYFQKHTENILCVSVLTDQTAEKDGSYLAECWLIV